MDRVVLSWSGGKDAAYALATLRERDVDVVELLTTVNAGTERSTMHGVRRSLYARQAAALGVPIEVVTLPANPSNDEYEATMARVLADYRERGVERVAFGDVHLEDVRAYREDRLADAGVDGDWPLWGDDTTALARDVLDAGFEATVVAVDGDVLDESHAGRAYDETFLADLPDGVDPCGENGEFHTFVRDGPVFESPVPVETNGTVTRSVAGRDFHYCDLRMHDG